MLTSNNLSTNCCQSKHQTWQHSIRRTLGRSALAIFIITGLSACGDDVAINLGKYVDEVKARQQSSIPPLPKPKEFRIFAYDDSILRNPFAPTVEIVPPCRPDKDNCVEPVRGRPAEVLEQYALGSLKMMGSLEKNGKLWALVRASDGTLYRTTVGKHLGKNNGRIFKITESEIELKEIVPDGLGGWIERTSTLTASE